MSNALMRGRTLDFSAAALARKKIREHKKYLEDRLKEGSITFKERHELIFKWVYKLEGMVLKDVLDKKGGKIITRGKGHGNKSSSNTGTKHRSSKAG